MWLTVFYEIITIVLILLFGWNMLTSGNRARQISTVICLVPLLLRVLYIH
jgi:hypothetical protein